MDAFISHNKADKESARLLAIALVEQGVLLLQAQHAGTVIKSVGRGSENRPSGGI